MIRVKWGNKMNIGFDMVICVTGDENFKEGYLYPQVGTNNGIQVVFENYQHNASAITLQTGGIGEGLFNPFDNSGAPSFDPVEKDEMDFIPCGYIRAKAYKATGAESTYLRKLLNDWEKENGE